MNETFTLSDREAISDLAVYISRASRVDSESIRLVAAGGVLAVYAPVVYARGLLDRSPTVLGLRTFAEVEGIHFDRTVIPASMNERLVRLQNDGGQRVTMPPSDVRAAWTGVAPPRGGWSEIATIDSAVLKSAARDGAERISEALPTDAGDPVVHQIRTAVWGAEMEDAPGVPAGAAFAADSLGFAVESEPVRLLESGAWKRLSLRRGHVLFRQS